MPYNVSQQSEGIVDSTWCNNSCRSNQKQAISIHLIRKSFLPFKLYTAYLQEKSSHQKSHTFLTDSQYSFRLLQKCSRLQHQSQREHLQACKRSDFFFWLILLVSSLPSMTTLRFPHASSMALLLVNLQSFQCHPYHYHLVLPQL